MNSDSEIDSDSESEYEYVLSDIDESDFNTLKSYTFELEDGEELSLQMNNSYVFKKRFKNISEKLFIKIENSPQYFLVKGICTHDGNDEDEFNDEENSIYTWILKSYFKNKQIKDLQFILHDIRTCIQECTKRCFMCYSEFPCQVPKPVTCNSVICKFQCSELGLGYSLEYYFVFKFKVLSLLVNIYKSTININLEKYSVDKLSYMTPEIDKLILNIDLNKLQEYAKKNTLRQNINPDVYSALSWIISSNRCVISYDKTTSSVEKYRIDSLSPEKECLFNLNAEKYGTRKVFHGSCIHNWHGIIHDGLKVFSNTKFQANGAAHGNGIYVSENFNTAYGYSKKGNSGIFPLKCIAVCEIINRYKKTEGGYCTVITSEEDIKLKSLYVGKSIGNISLN